MEWPSERIGRRGSRTSASKTSRDQAWPLAERDARADVLGEYRPRLRVEPKPVNGAARIDRCGCRVADEADHVQVRDEVRGVQLALLVGPAQRVEGRGRRRRRPQLDRPTAEEEADRQRLAVV